MSPLTTFANSSGDLTNRQRERWLPLLAIARVFCPDRLQYISLAAHDVGGNILADPMDTAFLRVLDRLVSSERAANLGAADISTMMFNLSDLHDLPQAGFVGRLIRKYFGKIGRRSGAKGGNRYPFTRAQVDDLLRRYPIEDGSLTEASEGTEGLSVELKPPG